MLSETQIKNLKPKDKAFKVSDRDGLYLIVTPSGTKSFRFNYKINGRYETITFGRWKDQITLAEARQKLAEAKRLIAKGVSPSIEKKRSKTLLNASQGTVEDWAERFFAWKQNAPNTDRTRRYTFKNHIKPRWGSWKLSEVRFQDIRNAVDEIVETNSPTAAIAVRHFMSYLFDFAMARDESFVENPARRIKVATIHQCKPRERALSEEEIANFVSVLKDVPAVPQNRMGAMLLLLTMVRKNELIEAKWSEIDFEKRIWSIPAERMKMGRAHNVYLSRQVFEIFQMLKMASGGSEFIFEPFSGRKLSKNTLNRVLMKCVEIAKERGLKLDHFTPHDFRRTASTHLHEAGFNSDVIEKCLAHEQGGVRAVYNKAEYAEQRKKMLQDWADMIDGWCEEYKDDVDETIVFKSVRQIRASK